MFGLIYLSTHSCDAMYRVQESKSKLELFYRLFTKLFLSQFLALGLKIFNVFHLPPTLFLSLPSLLQRMGRDLGITLWYGITILGKNKKRFGFQKVEWRNPPKKLKIPHKNNSLFWHFILERVWHWVHNLTDCAVSLNKN